MLDQEEQRRRALLGVSPGMETMPSGIAPTSGLSLMDFIKKLATTAYGQLAHPNVTPEEEAYLRAGLERTPERILPSQPMLGPMGESVEPLEPLYGPMGERVERVAPAPVPVPVPVPVEPKAPTKKGTKPTPKSKGTATPTPVVSPAISPLITPQTEAIPQVPTMTFTPPVDTEGELTNILNALPQRLEDLAGPRPQVRKPEKWWEQLAAIGLLSPAVGAAGGWDQYWQRKQDILEKPWKEQAAFQKERANLIKDFKLKSLEYKMEQNKEIREKEEQAYAKLGENNPLLAQSPAYMAGLFKNLPREYREKLLAESIDPKTGQFKPGAALYASPEKKWKYKLASVAGIAADLGITDPKEQAQLAINPEKFMEVMNSHTESLEKQLTYLLTQPQTPQNKAKIAEIIAIKRKLDEKYADVPDYMKTAQNIAFYNKQRESQKQRAVASFNTHKDKARLQADVTEIDNYFNDLIDMANTYLGGKGYAIAVRGKAQAQKEPQTEEYKLLLKSQPGLNPNVVNKADVQKNLTDTILVIDRLSTHPIGVDVDVWATKNLSTIELPIYHSLRKAWIADLGGAGLSPLLAEAAKKYGGPKKIPFKQIYQAALTLNSSPTQTDLVRKALLGE